MGTPSIPLLQRLLQDTDSEVRWRAAESLGKIGPAAKESYKALGAVLNDGSAQVRMAGIQAIWKINSDAATVVPALIRELTHADRQIRIQAFRQLTSMGSAARIGIGQLTALLDDERSYVRQSAAMTASKTTSLGLIEQFERQAVLHEPFHFENTVKFQTMTDSDEQC